MYKRNLQTNLLSVLSRYPIVTLTGPRQSGKSTLAKMALPEYTYVSLENPDHRNFALTDPRGFLDRYSSRVILDEAQRAPDLFSYLQERVDNHPQPGQYLLSGSQNFLLTERITQSLAGRCAVRFLLPFSYAELQRREAVNPLDDENIRPPRSSAAPTLEELLFTGGYPRIYDQKLPPQEWLADYFHTYLERDVRQLVHIGDLETFGRFVRLCAGRCGQLLNMTSLANDAGISTDTVRRWLSVLQASFIIHLLRPHHRNFNKRLVRSPRLYFLDTGLLCYLLGIRRREDLQPHAQRGAIFESWIISETLKACYHQGREADMYFWRDSTGHEVDMVLERPGTLYPVEIKSAQTFHPDFLAGLKYWGKLTGRAQACGSLIYGGSESYRREGFDILSWQDWT